MPQIRLDVDHFACRDARYDRCSDLPPFICVVGVAIKVERNIPLSNSLLT